MGEPFVHGRKLTITTHQTGFISNYQEFDQHLAGWFTYGDQMRVLQLLVQSPSLPPAADWKPWSASWNVENLTPPSRRAIATYIEEYAKNIFINIDEIRLERGPVAFPIFPILNGDPLGRTGICRTWRKPLVLKQLREVHLGVQTVLGVLSLLFELSRNCLPQRLTANLNG